MSVLWLIIMLSGIVATALKNPDGLLTVMTSGVSESFELCVTLLGAYCVWGGFIEIMKEAGALSAAETLLKPIITKLFGELSPRANQYLLVNVSANLIGVANASTPTAVAAIELMPKAKNEKMSRAMATLFLLNASGLELIPSTVMGLRAAAGSTSPADIFLPCLIVTVATTALSIALAFLFFKPSEDSK